ncbi:glycosyltransferase [Halorubellus litoreus]|uniref:Glycosyltransferase n=1 Tax=Halorubellus litoreus TaxID=755308 RepID=A0ABD5VN01_9EURY
MKVLQLITSTRTFFEAQVDELEDRGVECTTLSVPGSYAPDEPRTPSDYLQFVPDVLGESLEDYDLVHANYGLVGPYALADVTTPTVLTLWGTDLMSDRGWLRALSRASARAADEVVLPSRAMAPGLSTSYTHVPFGVDTDLFAPMNRDAAREQVGWPTGETIALFPYDTTREEKDFARAERVCELADADVDLRPLSGVDHDEVPTYMNASDCLLVTSKRESGPMTVKEAAACNVPVVSTDVGFVRDVVGDVPGCVVSDANPDLADGLDRLAAAEHPRTNARSTAAGVVSHAEFGDRLLDVYESALA